ncbi:MAG: 6-carboxytetrahydropterin synthase QueD [Elusimicrobiota bacterium]
MYKISIKSNFSAAHHLFDYNGNCENIHGHNFKVIVTAGYESVPSSGMAIDFRELKDKTNNVLKSLDHKDINKLDYFKKINPTSENIAKYIFDRVSQQDIPVLEVTVFETDKYSASYSK